MVPARQVGRYDSRELRYGKVYITLRWILKYLDILMFLALFLLAEVEPKRFCKVPRNRVYVIEICCFLKKRK